MKPHSNLVRNRKKHIEVYVETYVSICLCGSKNHGLRYHDSQ